MAQKREKKIHFFGEIYKNCHYFAANMYESDDKQSVTINTHDARRWVGTFLNFWRLPTNNHPPTEQINFISKILQLG